MSKKQHLSGATISSRYDQQKYGAIFFIDRKVNSSSLTAQQTHILDPYHALIPITTTKAGAANNAPRLHVQHIEHIFHLIEKLKLISYASQPLTYSHIYYKMRTHVSTRNSTTTTDNDGMTTNDTDDMKRKKRRRKQQQYASDQDDDPNEYDNEKSEPLQQHIDNNNDDDSNLDSSDDDEAFDQGSVTSNRYIASVIKPEQSVPKHLILNHSFFIPLTAVNSSETSNTSNIPTPTDQQLKDKHALRQRLQVELKQQKTFLWDHYAYVPYERLIQRFGGECGENLDYIQSRVNHEMRKLFTSQYYRHQEPTLSLTRQEYETLYPEYGPLPVLQNFIHITCSEIYYPASGKYHSFLTTSTTTTHDNSDSDSDSDEHHNNKKNNRQPMWMVQMFIHPKLRPPKPAYPVDLHDHFFHNVIIQNEHTKVKQPFYDYDYSSRYSIRVLMKRWLYDDECVELYNKYDHTSHISINTSLNVLLTLYKEHISDHIIQHAIDTCNNQFDIYKIYTKIQEKREQRDINQSDNDNNDLIITTTTITDPPPTITDIDDDLCSVPIVKHQSNTVVKWEPIARKQISSAKLKKLQFNMPKKKTPPTTRKQKKKAMNDDDDEYVDDSGDDGKNTDDDDGEFKLSRHYERQKRKFKIVHTKPKNDGDDDRPVQHLIKQRHQARSLLQSINSYNKYYSKDNKKTYVGDAFKHFATTYVEKIIIPQQQQQTEKDVKRIYDALLDVLFTRFICLDTTLSKIIEPDHVIVMDNDDDDDNNKQQKIYTSPVVLFKLIYILYLRDHKDTVSDRTFGDAYTMNVNTFNADHVVTPIKKRNISRKFIITFIRDHIGFLTQNVTNFKHYINLNFLM